MKIPLDIIIFFSSENALVMGSASPQTLGSEPSPWGILQTRGTVSTALKCQVLPIKTHMQFCLAPLAPGPNEPSNSVFGRPGNEKDGNNLAEMRKPKTQKALGPLGHKRFPKKGENKSHSLTSFSNTDSLLFIFSICEKFFSPLCSFGEGVSI